MGAPTLTRAHWRTEARYEVSDAPPTLVHGVTVAPESLTVTWFDGRLMSLRLAGKRVGRDGVARGDMRGAYLPPADWPDWLAALVADLVVPGVHGIKAPPADPLRTDVELRTLNTPALRWYLLPHSPLSLSGLRALRRAELLEHAKTLGLIKAGATT